jgi:hypothetical protein
MSTFDRMMSDVEYEYPEDAPTVVLASAPCQECGGPAEEYDDPPISAREASKRRYCNFGKTALRHCKTRGYLRLEDRGITAFFDPVTSSA